MIGFLSVLLYSAFTKADERTVLSWTRSADSCGKDDLSIPNGFSRMLWAYDKGKGVPSAPNKAAYHKERGTKSVALRGKVQVPELEEGLEYFDVGMDNLHVSGTAMDDPDGDNRTSYICTGFEIPEKYRDGTKWHIVKVEAIVEPKNYQKMHHIIMYECNHIKDSSLTHIGQCYNKNMPEDLAGCNAVSPIVGVYAIGGEPWYHPKEAGYPLGKLSGRGIYRGIMEFHYDNYNQKPFVDSSKMRYWVTKNLRQHDIGVLMIGSVFGLQIPAGEKEYEVQTRCPGTTTDGSEACISDDVIGKEGITITHSFMHMHTVGLSGVANVVNPDGSHKAQIIEEPYYDFNMQNWLELRKPYQLVPGDSIDVRCTFNTENRNKTVTGGLSTSEEMCLGFFQYWPARDFHMCIMYDLDKDGNITDITPDGRKQTHCMTNDHVDGLKSRPVEAFNMDYIPQPEIECDPVEPPQGENSVALSHGFQNVEEVEDFLATYEHSVQLHDTFTLYYNDNEEDKTVDFAVDVATDGWVGMGHSMTGDMAGGDIVMGWVLESGEVHLDDRFAPTHGIPRVDAVQSIWKARGTKIDHNGQIVGRQELSQKTCKKRDHQTEAQFRAKCPKITDRKECRNVGCRFKGKKCQAKKPKCKKIALDHCCKFPGCDYDDEKKCGGVFNKKAWQQV